MRSPAPRRQYEREEDGESVTWTMTFNSSGGVSYVSQDGDNTPDEEKHRVAMVVMGKAQEMTRLKDRLSKLEKVAEAARPYISDKVEVCSEETVLRHAKEAQDLDAAFSSLDADSARGEEG